MKLYIVPSPIGNLEDMSFRALRVLKEAGLILAEDTRTSGILLKHYQIHKPLQAYHQHNEHQVTGRLVELMQQGTSCALLSDAGTPGLSDPGFLLVRAAVRAGIEVECLPGATAMVPALVASALPMNRFVFEGFLPLKKGRQTLLETLAGEPRTIVLYESPMRLRRTLKELIAHFGPERACSVSREISKMFEQHVRGSLAEVLAYFEQHGVKGELVLVIEGFG